MGSTQPAETSSLQFIKWTDLYKTERPYQIFIDLPPEAADAPRTNVSFESHEVLFHDVRGEEERFDMDTHGFIVRAPGDIEGFVDPSTEFVENVYLPSVEALLKKEVPGADRVKIFDWRLRSARTREEGESVDLKKLTDRLAPANSVHVDQSRTSAIKMVNRTLPDEAEKLLQGRVRIINVWRPLAHTVEDWPLAVCDGSTITYDDLLETDIVREDFRDHVGSSSYALHQERYKWHYLSRQRTSEVMLFKQYDSDTTTTARMCPHASFQHRVQREGIPPRESVEVRALVFTDV